MWILLLLGLAACFLIGLTQETMEKSQRRSAHYYSPPPPAKKPATRRRKIIS